MLLRSRFRIALSTLLVKEATYNFEPFFPSSILRQLATCEHGPKSAARSAIFRSYSQACHREKEITHLCQFLTPSADV